MEPNGHRRSRLLVVFLCRLFLPAAAATLFVVMPLVMPLEGGRGILTWNFGLRLVWTIYLCYSYWNLANLPSPQEKVTVRDVWLRLFARDNDRWSKVVFYFNGITYGIMIAVMTMLVSILFLPGSSIIKAVSAAANGLICGGFMLSNYEGLRSRIKSLPNPYDRKP